VIGFFGVLNLLVMVGSAAALVCGWSSRYAKMRVRLEWLFKLEEDSVRNVE
jgi:hypothetical protein